MLLLSLGPGLVSALLHGEAPRGFDGPDLSWLLFGPDIGPVQPGPAENPQPLQAAE